MKKERREIIMNAGGDASDKVISFVLEGTEIAFRIAGDGAKNIGAVLCAIMKDHKQTKGKTRLTNLLKTGKELKIYSFKAEDLKKFSQEAKRYGVLYCVLANKKNQKIDGIVDIMVREEDASKVNRISERFAFAEVDRATISRELGLDKENGQEPQDKGVQEKSELDMFIDDILSKPIQKEEQQHEVIEQVSPSSKDTEGKSLSEISSNIKPESKVKNNGEDKKSVKEELREIEKEVQAREAMKENAPEEIKVNTNVKQKQPKHKQISENNKKGKHYKEPKHFDNSRKKKKSKRKER